MARAGCVIRLEGNQLDGTDFSCTGSQLASILKALRSLAVSCTWYAADLEITGEDILALNINAPYPVPVMLGNTEALIAKTAKVAQFLSGVFIAVPGKHQPEEWWRLFYTEDAPFEELGQALYEIRAFDTTYFEVYAKSRNLLQKLADTYGREIECA